MENLELKKYMGTICELEDRTLEITQSEQRKKTEKKKSYRASETAAKDLTTGSLESLE